MIIILFAGTFQKSNLYASAIVLSLGLKIELCEITDEAGMLS